MPAIKSHWLADGCMIFADALRDPSEKAECRNQSICPYWDTKARHVQTYSIVDNQDLKVGVAQLAAYYAQRAALRDTHGTILPFGEVEGDGTNA